MARKKKKKIQPLEILQLIHGEHGEPKSESGKQQEINWNQRTWSIEEHNQGDNDEVLDGQEDSFPESAEGELVQNAVGQGDHVAKQL